MKSEGALGTLVVLVAVAVFIAAVVWGIAPYLTSALERIQQVTP